MNTKLAGLIVLVIAFVTGMSFTQLTPEPPVEVVVIESKDFSSIKFPAFPIQVDITDAGTEDQTIEIHGDADIIVNMTSTMKSTDTVYIQKVVVKEVYKAPERLLTDHDWLDRIVPLNPPVKPHYNE